MSDKASSIGLNPDKTTGNGIMEKRDLIKPENKKQTETTGTTDTIVNTSQLQNQQPIQPKDLKNRCNLGECNKKLSLVESTIKCKCGNTYCTLHRYSEQHDCTFDYKADSEKARKKILVQVTANKITKI